MSRNSRGFGLLSYVAAIAAIILLGVIAWQAVTISSRGDTIADLQLQLATSRSEFSTYRETSERQAREASDTARKNQADLQHAAEEARKEKDAQIQTVSAQLAATVRELRNRPERPAAAARPAVAGAAAAPEEVQGCTGAQLYRADGEFLAGEAAAASRLQLDYLELWDVYERARVQAERSGEEEIRR